MPKPVAKSRTIWFNLLSLLGVALVTVADHALIVDNPALAGAAAVAIALVNLGLRLVTRESLL